MSQAHGRELNQLFSRAIAGDSDAFTLVYEEFYTPVYRYMYYRVHDSSLAEDLTQTVFFKLLEKPRLLKKNTSVQAYLYTIARNTVIDYVRKKKDTVASNFEEQFELIIDETQDPEQLVSKKEDKKFARELLLLLTSEQQEILTLKYIYELSYKEIAQIVGKNEAAIRKIQSRGLARIREKNNTTYEQELSNK